MTGLVQRPKERRPQNRLLLYNESAFPIMVGVKNFQAFKEMLPFMTNR